MTYRGRDWGMCTAYWFEIAKKTMRRPLWPRTCDLTEKTLWWSPAVRGFSEYWTRGGSYRTDVRWADPRALVELGLRGKLNG